MRPRLRKTEVHLGEALEIILVVTQNLLTVLVIFRMIVSSWNSLTCTQSPDSNSSLIVLIVMMITLLMMDQWGP